MMRAAYPAMLLKSTASPGVRRVCAYSMRGGGGVQAALNQKMADFTADAKQFTMDGGIVYDFKDEDDYKTAKKDLSHLKKAMASNWVEQPRQRKVRINYNEADFLKGAHLILCCLIYYRPRQLSWTRYE